MKRNTLVLVVTWLASACFTTLLIFSLRAFADGNPATDTVPRLVPYQGTLEKDGNAFNGQIDMVFRIYDGAAATTAAWEETQTVTVYAGRFSVLLGSTSAASASNLATVMTAADDQYLGITLVTADGETALGNRQRFVPMPYALWSTAATHFRIGGDLTLGGKVAGHLNVYGPDINFTSHPERGNGGRALVHYDSDSLVLNFNGDFSGGVQVSSNTRIVGQDNDGTNAALRVANGTTQVMLLDGNEIDAVGEGNLDLWLNNNSTGAVRVGHDLRVGGILNVGGTDLRLAEQRALVRTAGDGLIINPAAEFGAGTAIESDLSVSGALSVNADTTLSGDLSVDGAITGGHFACRDTACGAQVLDVAGGMGWGSWQGWTRCPANTYVCGLEQRVEGSQGDNDDTAVNDIQILCCPF